MTVEAPTPNITPDELLRMPNGADYELIDGYPKEISMGAEASLLTVMLSRVLSTFIFEKKLGLLFDSQTGYVCFPDRPRMLRKPDLSFVAANRLPDNKPPKGNITIAPDLVVEVISPHDTYEEVLHKVDEYFSAGVKLIWIVSPESRCVNIRRLDSTSTIVAGSDYLDGESVLPGFRVPLTDIFVLPE